MATIGIDFGSSYTSASWLNPKSGFPEAIIFGNDQVKLPSLLLATENGLLVGSQAKSYLDEVSKLPVEQRFEIMDNFVPCLKSLLDDDTPEIFYGTAYTHKQLLEIFLKEIVTQAQKHCGVDYRIDTVKFTHPVNFSDNAKLLIKEAFENIALKVEGYLPEPESAVRGYALNHVVNSGEGLLVFDFGGGTIDVAYVHDFSGDLKVATIPKGNSHCGGNDIDHAIYEHFRNRIKKELNYDVTQHGMVDSTVMSCCRKLKELFSGTNEFYEIPSLLIIEGHLNSYKFGLNREAFNSIIYPKVHEAIEVAKQVVTEVKQNGYRIDKALLIGGSSRLTLVQGELKKLLGDIPVDTFGEKDIAVALGAIAELANEITVVKPVDPPLKNEAIVDWSIFKEPLSPLINCIDGGGCFQCRSKECYKLKEPRGIYRCIKCGWEGKNIVLTY